MSPDITLVTLYIEPGIGSTALQILAASLLGVTVFFRSTTAQILKQVRHIFRRSDNDNPC